MEISNQFDIILNNSIEDKKTNISLHLIEEMSELTCELLNFKRKKSHNVISELSDVYFQIHKLMKVNKLTDDYMKSLIIKKTKVRFPEQLKERSTK